jgi:hypothetical protein
MPHNETRRISSKGYSLYCLEEDEFCEFVRYGFLGRADAGRCSPKRVGFYISVFLVGMTMRRGE